MPTYPHMCRDGHPEIGHSDSEHEQCPLCRLNAEIEKLREEMLAIRAASGLDPLVMSASAAVMARFAEIHQRADSVLNSHKRHGESDA